MVGKLDGVANSDPDLRTASSKPTDKLPAKGTVRVGLSPERAIHVSRAVRKRARESEQEQGINTLFAACGTLKWRESATGSGSDAWRYAPLLLLPVRIEENVRAGRHTLLATGDDPEYNQTLAERLRRDFRIELPIDVDVSDADDMAGLAAILQAVRSAVALMPDWEVLDEVNVGTFKFHKLRMFQDLDEHRDVAIRHPIVQALADPNRTVAGLPSDVPRPEDLDRVVTPKQTFSVLDADASQMWAIQAAKRGSNLIVQGPPGTGKSQTIANIIAECLAANKTVLFVSEKAAAIEVVHRRLTQRGLGEFCLMLHSQKSNKLQIVRDLAARLTPATVDGDPRQEDHDLDRLGQVRERLNAYATSLHRRHEPLGRSAFEVHGLLTALDDNGELPDLVASMPSVSMLTWSALEGWQTIVGEAVRSAPVLAEGDLHIWAGFRLREIGFTERSELTQLLTDMSATLNDTEGSGARLASTLGMPAPETIPAARALRDLAEAIPVERVLRADWLGADQHARATMLLNEAMERTRSATEMRTGLFSRYGDRILRVATPETIATYETGWFSRLFSGPHRGARAAVRAASIDAKQRSVTKELADLRRAAELHGQLAWFGEQETPLRTALGVDLDPTGIADAGALAERQADLAASASLIDRYRLRSVPASLVAAIGQPGAGVRVATALSELNDCMTRLISHLAGLQRFFEPETMVVRSDTTIVPIDQGTVGLGREWLEARLQRMDDLDDWLRAQRAADAIRAAGLTDAVAELERKGVDTVRWVDTLTRTALRRWLDYAYRQDGMLSRFSGADHERDISAFRDLDRRQVDFAVRRIRRRLATGQPNLNGAVGEPGILLKEANKRRNVKPLRWLFARIPTLVPILKPCLMMSPLSVAQFLPADQYHFDVIMFDEASQVRPHDAIGSIMRGTQLIVAGDEQQLPPTSFFDRSSTETEDDSDEDDSLAAMESILGALSAKQMPTAPLLWHYRSRHEDLIAFSNHNIYDGRLITFPSPSAERGPRAGVRLEYVPDGVYDVGMGTFGGSSDRSNPVEAKRVVELVMAHVRERPDESLGVVALNEDHAQTIQSALFVAQQATPELQEFFREDRPDPFFVKPLELIQGDERDVILISIGFGRNAKGVLSHNFGPINNEGGERRLNVLVTRAREQIVVVSSIRAGDIDLNRTQKLGPKLLRDYLDFAERGAVALSQATRGGDGAFESPFEASVCVALESAGHTVRRQVGASSFRIDLAIVDPRQPGRYLLGIECDGATYHSSKTARDRDRLRQEILEGLGWTIHRVWSTDWIRNPQRALAKLTDRIEALLAQPVAKRPVLRELSPPQPTETVIQADSPTLSSGKSMGRPGTETFVIPTDRPPLLPPYRMARLTTRTGELTATPIALVAEVVIECVTIEGPIHRELLGRRIAGVWGHGRQGNRIVSHLDAAVALAVLHGNIRQFDAFLWPTTSLGLVARGPAIEGEPRAMGVIAGEELVLGMVAVLGQALSLPADELITQTTRAFGFQRVGADNRARLVGVLGAAVASKQIEAVGEMYRLPRT